MILVALLLAAVGYGLMYLTATMAHGWLTRHTSTAPPPLLLDGFLPWERAFPDHLAWFVAVLAYQQERGRRKEPLLVAYLFWLGCCLVVAGGVLFWRDNVGRVSP